MTSKALREVCVGLQTEAGSAVNVDTALRAVCTLKPNVTKNHPEENIGSHAPARHYVAQAMPEGSIKADAIFEDLPIYLSMALGDVTPTGSEDPWTWSWDLPDSTSPTFDLWTLEYTDGGTYVVRGTDIFATALTISGEAGGGIIIEAVLGGGRVDLPDSLSASPTPIATPTAVKMANTALYIDSAYGSVGTTLIEDAFINFSWKLENLLHTKQFAGSLYPNGRGSSIWKTTLEMTLEVASATAQALADAVLATTQKAIEVKVDTASDDTLTIDGVYMIEDVASIDERDGNNIIKVSCLGEKDSSDNTGAVTVETNKETL